MTIVYIHIRYTLYTLKRQPSSTVIGKQEVNRVFFCEVLLIALVA